MGTQTIKSRSTGRWRYTVPQNVSMYWWVALALCLSTACADSTGASEEVEASSQAVAGNVHPAAIQIDGPVEGSPGADLYADAGVPLNVGATADWVRDELDNQGTGCLGDDAIASCIEPGVTGAPDGMGHWNGIRVVDGIAAGDQDIFLTGGKEDDFATWNIGAGSVGSSKYDIVQAYLANNQSTLFFGMERRGNNGTTAFDFEFNQVAPASESFCPPDPLIPCRTEGDVLFVFELRGSGGTGSAMPYVFTWDGTTFVPASAAGLVSSINDSMNTRSGPWGHVDSKGNWVLGDLARFELGEAAAPISLLPGVDECGGRAFVQVRTRSSVQSTSDLKDATKIFEFNFQNVEASATLTPSCDQSFSYAAAAKDADGNPIANPTCAWTFSDGSTSDACAGVLVVAPGTYTGTVEVSDPSNPACSATKTSNSVQVFAPLGVTASLSATCNNRFDYSAMASGGSNPSSVSYAWAFSGGGTTTPSMSTSMSGTVVVGTPGVSYQGAVTVTDPRTDLTCTADAQASATPLAPLTVDLTLGGAGGTCPMLANDAVTYTATPSGGDGMYAYAWSDGLCSGTSCTIDPADGTFCHEQSLTVILSDGSGLCSDAMSEAETYAKVTTVTASDNP